MRQSYEAPEIAMLGSVEELTRASLLGPGVDNLSYLPIFGGGSAEDPFS